MSEQTTEQQVPKLQSMLGQKHKTRGISSSLVPIGKNIKGFMKNKRITINQLAVKTNIPTGTIHGWIIGKNFPSKDGLHKIAKGLKVNQSKLITGVKNGS